MTNSTDNQQISQAIESLQQSFNNIKIFTAVPMGILMILYFFSFATLIDKGMNGALWFEIITSILFVFYFIYINKAAFIILKFLNRNRARNRDILSLLTASELLMKPEALSNVIVERQ